MTQTTHVPTDSDGRRLTLRRGAALLAPLGVVSALVTVAGPGYLWPLFLFPLVLAAVFFFELGSLAVTLWLGNFFVFYFSFVAPATPECGASGAARHRPVLRHGPLPRPRPATAS